MSIKTFKVSSDCLKVLSPDEKKMLPLLVEAAKKVDKIFQLQENRANNGANFYPRDAIKKEILDASAHDSKILSPFTVVKRDSKGKLIAQDYHEEYKRQLLPISSLLKKASDIAKNETFKKYLLVTSSALLNGKYSEIDKAWLQTKKNNLDIVIGPYERYLDKLFFVKRAFQADVSIIDREKSKRATVYRDILYTSVGPNVHRVIPPSQNDIQVKETLIFSGFLSAALFTQQHLPSETDSVEKYGSRILVYQSTLNYKFEKLIYPIFLATFAKNFRVRYSKELVRTGSYYHVILSGIIQHLHRYRGSRTRLRELFPIFDEANTAASGIQHAKHLVLKGVLDQKELEATMIAQICWIFSEWIISRKNTTRDVYLKGDALVFNFLQREGALLEKEGVHWPNFAKMFFELENLSTIFTRILEEGTYIEAQEFLSNYLSLDPIEAFDRKLAKIQAI